MKITPWLLFLLLGLVGLNATDLLYFNVFTHSLPYGIYLRIQGIPHRGEYASSCLTPEIARYGIARDYLVQGNCGTGTVHVLKKIMGFPGDYFVVNNGLLELNGHAYPIKPVDSSGRLLKVFYSKKEGIINKGRYMLLSDFAQNSWDSRYWGPVSIEFLLKPWWIWEKTGK